MDTGEPPIRILMLPWLAHGHISPFLELAKRLTERNFIIYICSTHVNLNSIKNKFSVKHSKQIQLVELRLPPSPELPPHYHTTNGLPPRLITTLIHAFRMAGPRFSNVVSCLNPDLIIYDYNQPWAAEVASAFGIPAVQFLTISAATLLHVIYMFERPGEKFPFQEISLRDYEKCKFRDLNSSEEADQFLEAFRLSKDFVLIKTCREMEGKYIDFVSDVSSKTVVPVGPLAQDLMNEDGSMEILQWLEKKEKKSVVFVSFGSEYFLSQEEREVVAKGLELSMVSFIWVVRFPNGGKIKKIEEALPQGFLDRVGNRGFVVEGWAPQARILGQPSIGGFVSHCGWGSIVESIKFGVPVIAMPMHVDQPINARLVETVGLGVEAIRDKNGKFQHEEIAKVIRKVVVDENGEDVRKKVRQMSEKFSTKMEDGMDQVVEKLITLGKRKNTI